MELENIVANTVYLKAREGKHFSVIFICAFSLLFLFFQCSLYFSCSFVFIYGKHCFSSRLLKNNFFLAISFFIFLSFRKKKNSFLRIFVIIYCYWLPFFLVYRMFNSWEEFLKNKNKSFTFFFFLTSNGKIMKETVNDYFRHQKVFKCKIFYSLCIVFVHSFTKQDCVHSVAI